MKTRRSTAAAILIVPAILLALFTAGDIRPANAQNGSNWITIDASEYRSIIGTEPGLNFAKRVRKVAEKNGLAVLEISEPDLEALSEAMHKHFNKCAGFMWHATEGEALRLADGRPAETSRASLAVYTIDNNSNVAPMISSAREMPVRQTILDLSSYLTRRHDSETGLLSANYINFRWGQIAATRDDMSVSFFNHPTEVTPQPSVILTIEGTDTPDEVVVLGGHQDSINRGGAGLAAPGADDDASGIASLTEAIRVIAESGFRPKKTVQFMAYAAEEVGLRGSADIAQSYAAENKNVIGVFQLDMTNYSTDPTIDFAFITDWTNGEQNQFLRDLIDNYLPGMTYADDVCGYACSDHASWTQNSFVASFPHEAPFGSNNVPNIHTANDTISLSGENADRALKFTKLALAYVGELAKGSLPFAQPKTLYDFDGDSRTDVSLFRPNTGPVGGGSQWWMINSGDGSSRGLQFGTPSDKPVPADFTGDGKTDVAFYRAPEAKWYVLRSEDDAYFAFPFGAPDDIPAPADFDGDGKADPAVYRPSESTWYILRSSDSQITTAVFGIPGDRPIPADFDGDGKADPAVYRPGTVKLNSQFWVLGSGGGIVGYEFGKAGDLPVIGDWTGDGKADISFYRPSTSEWFVNRSEDLSFYSFVWGLPGDSAQPGDYDGDGITDPAVWRESDTTWYILGSTAGFSAAAFGSNGDIPLPGSANGF